MKRFIGTVNLILIWILFSLLAIALIGSRPLVGLAVAIVGGIVLGIASYADYETRQRETSKQPQPETGAETARLTEGLRADQQDHGPEQPSLED